MSAAEEYTPSTERVRAQWAYEASSVDLPHFRALEAFDRWLAKHDAEVKAQAWDEGYDARGQDIAREGLTHTTLAPNPYRAEPDAQIDHFPEPAPGYGPWFRVRPTSKES